MVANAQAEEIKLEGNELFRKGKYHEALKKYRKAAKLDRNNAVYWSNMAACHEKIGDLLEFKESARKCIALDPSFVKGYWRLATVQRRLWEYDDARTTIRRGLEVDPGHETLLQMKVKNEGSLECRRECQKVILTAPEQDFEYYGGLRPGSGCAIPRDTAYFQLPRPALPRYSKKHGHESYPDERVESVFECFCNGDLAVQWRDTEKLFELQGFAAEDDRKPVIVFTATFVPRENGKIETFAGHITEQNQTYHNRLTTDQKQQLKLLLLQRFLRSEGWTLDSSKVLCMCDVLAEDCQTVGLYKEGVTMRLICTDILCNQRSEMAAYSVYRLGEALEASKQFHDAAEIYLDLANGKIGQNAELPEERTRGFAALAFKRDMDYVQAEREYVGSLRATGSDWHWRTHEFADRNLQNMMIFYEIVHRAVVSGLRTDEAHKTMQQSLFLLVGLLSIAGYQGLGCTLFQDPGSVTAFKSLLKPQYKSPRAAFQAVVSATASPSIEEYHRVLFSFRKENLVCLSTGDPGPDAEAELLREQRKKAKSGAREQTQNNQANSMDACSRCGKCGERLLHCPCQTVRYCSKECQLAHFSYHKKHCAHVKAKREKASDRGM